MIRFARDFHVPNQPTNKSITATKQNIITTPTPLSSFLHPHSFQLFNYYEPVKFLFLRGGFTNKSYVAESGPVSAGQPQQPTQVKLAFTEDPSEMRVSWITQDEGRPYVRWGVNSEALAGRVAANASTYFAEDMCGAPANSTGFKSPGTILTAVMTGLEPNTPYYYVVGDEEAGTTSELFSFLSPPGPEDTVKMLAFADVGAYNEDFAHNFGYWYATYGLLEEFYALGSIQYTALQAVMTVVGQQGLEDGAIYAYWRLGEAAGSGEFHSAWHNGDLSYARGLAWEWDTFGHLMEPITSLVPTMYTPGNHEYDWEGAPGNIYPGAQDSGGECGVPYRERHFMPAADFEGQWYSLDHGPVHFLQLNTEVDYSINSSQWRFVVDDLERVDRSVTPWVVVGFHRMIYTDQYDGQDPASSQGAAEALREAFEDVFALYGVDMTWQGHNHAYQRTCPVYNNTCVGYDAEGVARAPIHVTMGHAGFMMSPHYQPVPQPAFEGTPEVAFFGFCRAEVNRTHFLLEMVAAENATVRDEILLTKPLGWELDLARNEQTMAETQGTPFTNTPSNSGFMYVLTNALSKFLYTNLADALAILGPSSKLSQRFNMFPGLPLSAAFIVETAQDVIGFLYPLVNATSLAQVAGPLPMPAEDIMESWEWAASAWMGRIPELVEAQGPGV